MLKCFLKDCAKKVPSSDTKFQACFTLSNIGDYIFFYFDNLEDSQKYASFKFVFLWLERLNIFSFYELDSQLISIKVSNFFKSQFVWALKKIKHITCHLLQIFFHLPFGCITISVHSQIFIFCGFFGGVTFRFIKLIDSKRQLTFCLLCVEI